MLNKSASKAFKKLEPLRLTKSPSQDEESIIIQHEPNLQGNGMSMGTRATLEVTDKKMLKKSASKALMKHEPLSSVDDTVRAAPRKSAIESTNSAVTSLTEVSDNVLQTLDDLVNHLSSNDHSTVSAKIIKVCKELKTYGHILERKDSMQMDRYFVFLRDAAQDVRIDTTSRVRLLELIELRASGWKGGDGLDIFYKSKLIELENTELNAVTANNGNDIQPLSSPLPFSSIGNTISNFNSLNNNSLSPGEVLKSSGKYGKPSKNSSKNYFKDEIVIHNADSGKVMGIKGRRVHMIEELSGTIVSFQRVLPGAKDRLVQITGPTESAVGHAQQLIEETIVRNTSPIRDRPNPLQTSESASNVRKLESSMKNSLRPSILHSMSMNDASLGEYQYTVNVGRDLIKLAGSKLEVIRTAKLVLEEYFAGDAKRTSHEMPLDELLTPSDDDLSSSSPSPTNFTATPLSRSASYGGSVTSSTGAPWEDRNGYRLNKAARITGRCISYESAVGSDDSDNQDEEYFCKGQATNEKSTKEKNDRITYPREALLMYSRTHYSKMTPKCLAKIIQLDPTMLKKTPEFFDPVAHNLCGSSVELTNGRIWGQNSRGGSQEIDDLDGNQ